MGTMAAAALRIKSRAIQLQPPESSTVDDRNRSLTRQRMLAFETPGTRRNEFSGLLIGDNLLKLPNKRLNFVQLQTYPFGRSLIGISFNSGDGRSATFT